MIFMVTKPTDYICLGSLLYTEPDEYTIQEAAMNPELECLSNAKKYFQVGKMKIK